MSCGEIQSPGLQPLFFFLPCILALITGGFLHMQELKILKLKKIKKRRKLLQMVISDMKLKDTCSWKESYDQPRQHIKK